MISNPSGQIPPFRQTAKKAGSHIYAVELQTGHMYGYFMYKTRTQLYPGCMVLLHRASCAAASMCCTSPMTYRTAGIEGKQGRNDGLLPTSQVSSR